MLIALALLAYAGDSTHTPAPAPTGHTTAPHTQDAGTLADPAPGEWPMFKRSLDHRGLADEMSGDLRTACVAWDAPVTGPKTRGAGGVVIARIAGRPTVIVAVDGNCDGGECRSGYGNRAVGGSVHAFDGATGDELWSFTASEPHAQFDPYGPLLADTDGDGDREFVVPSTDSGWVFALPTEGSTLGRPDWSIELPGGRVSEGAPAAAQLDTDPAIEIVLGDDAQGVEGDAGAKIWVLDGARGVAQGSLELPNRRSRDGQCENGEKADSSQPAIAQIGGAPMILTGAWNGSYYGLRWDGALRIAWERPLPKTEDVACGVPKVRSSGVVADLDGDGKLEVAFGWMYQEGQKGDTVKRESRAVLQVLDAATGEPEANGVFGDWKSSPSVADLDGTGGLELVAGRIGGVYAVHGNLSPLWEKTPLGSAERGNRSSPAIADIDGDHDLDVIIGIEGDAPSNDLGVRAFDGKTGQQLWAVPMGSEGQLFRGVTSGPAVGDVDGDGKLEVAILGLDGVLRIIDACP